MNISVMAVAEPFQLRPLIEALNCEAEPAHPRAPADEDVGLSAAAIEEALALVAQMTLLHCSPLLPGDDPTTVRAEVMGRGVTLMNQHLADESRLYVTALERFTERFSFEISENGDPLAAFAIVADLSLNPQLPPFFRVDTQAFDWHEILPSRRFLRLLDAVETIGLPSHNFADEVPEKVDQYRTRLLDAAGLSTWCVAEAQAALQAAIDKAGDGIPRLCADPTRFLYRAADQAVTLRKLIPYFFANPADVWSRERWASILKDDAFDLAWRCPFISLEGTSVANGISQRQFDEVMFSNMAQRTLLEYATTADAPEYDGFPADRRFASLREQIELWLRERYNGAFRV